MKALIVCCFILLGFSFHAQEMYITTSDSVRLFLKVKGTGPSCLYIHGGPGSGSNWLEEFMGEYLEQHFQMIYLDQRGVGRSSSPKDGNYSLQLMISDFEEIRNTLNINKWLTLGHSFGGLLQVNYTKRHPDVISGMIFINCTLNMTDSFGNNWLPKAIELAGKDTPEISKDTTVSIYQRMLAIMPVLGEKGEMWKIFFNNRESSMKMNETYGKFEAWNSDQSKHILEFDEYWSDYRTYSHDIDQPVLFYYGTTDWAIGPKHFLGVKFPEMILWAGETGHMPFIENKKDLIEAINSFIKTYSF